MTELIVALDVDTLADAERLVKNLSGTADWFKVGLRLFTAHGRKAVELVKKSGGRVFLDLKLHDIPQTVAHAADEAGKLGADAVSLHLLGGLEMISAAATAKHKPLLWGVTVLTSLRPEDLTFLGPAVNISKLAVSLAAVGQSGGIDAVICSPREVSAISSALPRRVKFVTPGIRPAGAALNDQARVMTPGDAAKLGVDYIVVGRPITHDKDPRAAARKIKAELSSVKKTARAA